MRAKSFIVLLLMIFAYSKANAWNVYVKSFNSYQMEYSSLEDISINGVAEKLGIINDIDLIVGTFGKAVSSMGAFVTGPKILIDFLINKSRPFIFSTALPPINIAFSNYFLYFCYEKIIKKPFSYYLLVKK